MRNIKITLVHIIMATMVIFAGLFIALLPLVAGQGDLNSTIVCIDDDLLLINKSKLKCIDGICKSLDDSQTEFCNYGCDSVTNRCSPNPFERNILLIGIFLFFLVIIILLARRLS